MKKIFLSLTFALTVAFAQQISVAVLPSDGTGASLSNDENEALTDKMRGAALKVLSGNNTFTLLKQDVIVKRLGGADNYIKECSESSCIVDLGKKAQVDYVAQASVGKLENKMRLKVELYSVSTEGLVGGIFSEVFDDYSSLLKAIEEKMPDEFRKIPDVSGRKISSPTFAGGIGGVQSTGGGYEFEGEKRYLADITTEPEGAVLSFDGIPNSRCTKTPCRVELAEGNIRIIANLEQYEISDTTVSVKQNNQDINIKLKANFGVLEVKPAYSNGIGKNENWNLSINNKAASSLTNRLSPNKYSVKLSHKCYDDIGFDVGINKGSREVFDMSSHIKLKKGGLVLSAEKDGEPVSEPVFVNGKQIGETPFSGSVPVCASVEIGKNRQKADIKLKHNEDVKYTHEMQEQSNLNTYETQKSLTIHSTFNKSLNIVPWGGIGYQRIWDMHHVWISGYYGSFYSTLGTKSNENDNEKKSELELMVGLIHRWIVTSDNFIRMGFGLFGGLGIRSIDYQYCVRFFNEQCAQFEEEHHSNTRHELGAELILGYLSLHISERNFNRIGGGIGLMFWLNRKEQKLEW